MPKPLCVISGDLHFTPSSLRESASVIKQMQNTAEKLQVPLLLNGDTLDTKCILRAEVVNSLIEMLQNKPNVQTYVNVGNHDMINEKGSEHSLNFLKPYCAVIQQPVYLDKIQSYVIPYQTSANALQSILNDIPEGSRLIVHQGVQTAFMGHYTQDKTSLPQEAFANYRVIASHYHRRQDIKCGRPGKGAVGLFSYVGNPYSLNFGEASDGPKGFSVLLDDGSLEFVPTNLRKHVVKEVTVTPGGGLEFDKRDMPLPDDIVWIKAKGSRSDLDKLDKKWLGEIVVGHTNYKLEKLYLEDTLVKETQSNITNAQLFDSIIDNLAECMDYKAELKKLWKDLV